MRTFCFALAVLTCLGCNQESPTAPTALPDQNVATSTVSQATGTLPTSTVSQATGTLPTSTVSQVTGTLPTSTVSQATGTLPTSTVSQVTGTLPTSTVSQVTGTLPTSTVSQVTVNDLTKMVSNLSARVSGTSIILTWDPPFTTRKLHTFVYRVNYHRWKWVPGRASARTLTISQTPDGIALIPGANYRLRVRPLYQNSDGSGRHTGKWVETSVRLAGTATAVPEKITSISYEVYGENTVVFDWDHPRTNGDLLRYEGRVRVRVSRTGQVFNFSWSALENLGTSGSWNYPNHLDGELRDYTVRGVNTAGGGPWSDVVVVDRHNPGRPGLPRNFTARRDDDNDHKWTLRWQRPLNNEGIDRYLYWYGAFCDTDSGDAPHRIYHVSPWDRDREWFSITVYAASDTRFSLKSEGPGGTGSTCTVAPL